jgi:hypothetical protein
MSVMVIFLHFFDYIRVSSLDTNKALCGKILAKTMAKSWQNPWQNLGKKHGKIFANILAKSLQNIGKIYAKFL